ncbi:hypothetical protein E4Z66_05455 [Aliishimia ponticola]|uniref:Uncharacterized protein n=1 Tax=Aliishimia ponticola TaxID=2499833 RepID=A0A4S4NH54_9RHOB|nr:hypothetical protein E4Z66_05455 [Aliishimia ponticola]
MAAKAPTFAAGGQGHIRAADVTAHTVAMLDARRAKALTFAAGNTGPVDSVRGALPHTPEYFWNNEEAMGLSDGRAGLV